jgi:O-antigen/teichoic acid export membrane protein
LLIKNKLSENKQKIFENIFWAMLGKIINLMGLLFVGILVARYLGPEQYGLMNYVISYVSIFTIISSFGLDDIEIRELSKQNAHKDFILGTAFRIRLTFACFTYLLILLTLWLFKPDLLTSLMIMAYAITVFTGCFNVIRNYFTSIVENKYVVKSEISRTLIGACIKLLLLWFKAPLLLFVVATAFDTILVAGGYIISYQIKVGRLSNWKYDKSMVYFLIKQSFPLLLSGTAIVIYQRIDQVMIGNIIDNRSVGFFATAGKFLDLVLFLPMILTQTITPLLVKKKEVNIAKYEIMKQHFVSIVVWFSIIISLIVSLLSYWLILFTYGEKYLPAVAVLQIMAWKTVGMALSSTSGQIIILEHIQKWAVIRNLIGTVICIGLNLIFIPRFGIIGSAWVTIITVFSSGFLANYFIPSYREIANIQIKAILFGWKDIVNISKFLNS